MIENVFLILLLFTFALGFVFISYTFFICKKLVPKVDEHLNGWNFKNDSLIAQVFRASDYFAICMQPKRAKKIGGFEHFHELDTWTRRHFIIWGGLPFIILFLGAIVGIMMHVFPELKRS